MRKKIFLTFIMIFAVTLIVAFVGCSNKDDEPDNGTGMCRQAAPAIN